MTRELDALAPVDEVAGRAAPAASGPRPRMELPSWLAVLLSQVLLICAVLVVWQMASVLGWGVKVVVQSPMNVLRAGQALHSQGELWPNYWSTLKATFYGLGISTVVGIPLGLMLGLSPFVLRVVAPLLSAINSMPRIALAPVFIVVFGIDTASKVALAVSLAIFIMVLNSVAGVSAADSEAVRMMKALGASRRQILFHVVLPAAMPSILAGVRLSVIYSLLGVIASELIASKDGIGQLIARSAGVFDLATVYAVLVLLMITATLFNGFFESLERVLLRWRPPTAQ